MKRLRFLTIIDSIKQDLEIDLFYQNIKGVNFPHRYCSFGETIGITKNLMFSQKGIKFKKYFLKVENIPSFMKLNDLFHAVYCS